MQTALHVYVVEDFKKLFLTQSLLRYFTDNNDCEGGGYNETIFKKLKRNFLKITKRVKKDLFFKDF